MTGTWPELPVADWADTRDTVQLWTQIVGKVRLALAPPENEWWQVALYVTASGLTTSLMPYRDHGLEIEFDFVDHELIGRTTRGARASFPLIPMSVATFYERFRQLLAGLDVDVPIMPRPVELAVAIPFARDETHRSYDAAAMHRFWLSLVDAHRVFSRFRGEFRGKGSPVHFFWGAFDLAVTRFSGRGTPSHPGGVPNCPDWVMHEAYDQELASCGYWPGGAEEGAVYAYSYPEPTGYRTYPIRPAAAFFDETLGEFLLPYRAVRTAADPDALLMEFLRSAFGAAGRIARPARPGAGQDADPITGMHAGRGDGPTAHGSHWSGYRTAKFAAPQLNSDPIRSALAGSGSVVLTTRTCAPRAVRPDGPCPAW